MKEAFPSLTTCLAISSFPTKLSSVLSVIFHLSPTDNDGLSVSHTQGSTYLLNSLLYYKKRESIEPAGCHVVLSGYSHCVHVSNIKSQ